MSGVATMEPAIYAAAGSALVAVLNELRARARARTADLDRQRRDADLTKLAIAGVTDETQGTETMTDQHGVKPLHIDGHPVAPWVHARLKWARHEGWTGEVMSGYRTDKEQLAAAKHYAAALGKTVKEVYPSGPLASNHCKLEYPGGAVDVTEPEMLDAYMRRFSGTEHGHPLVWGGRVIGDNAHFSSTGH